MEQTTAEQTAATVRAEMARRRISQRSMANDLKLPKSSLSRRLAGKYPFTITELAAIARYLDVSLVSLLPVDELAA